MQIGSIRVHFRARLRLDHHKTKTLCVTSSQSFLDTFLCDFNVNLITQLQQVDLPLFKRNEFATQHATAVARAGLVHARRSHVGGVVPQACSDSC